MKQSTTLNKDGQKMPLWAWFFFRLFVPISPILIQYALLGFKMYTPPFPQVSYITMMFSLSLATLTEYQNIGSIVIGSFIPALAGTFLYTIALIANTPEQKTSIYMVGFILWLMLVVINSIRVILSWLRATSPTVNGEAK